VFVQDEAIFVGDSGKATKHWFPVGERIHVAHAGSHQKFVAFGPVSDDGSQFFRTRDAFASPLLVPYLREMRRKFGRIAVVADRAPQHRARGVRGFLRSCGGEAGLSGLPVGSPQLNAMEEVWRRAKLAILDSEHHRSVGDMRAAASAHFGGCATASTSLPTWAGRPWSAARCPAREPARGCPRPGPLAALIRSSMILVIGDVHGAPAPGGAPPHVSELGAHPDHASHSGPCPQACLRKKAEKCRADFCSLLYARLGAEIRVF